MERLPNKVLENAIGVYETTLDVVGDNDKYENSALDRVTYNFLKELKAYRDAEEQGLLLRLPCKVGDVVYFTDRKYDRENKVFVPFVHNGYVKAIKFSARPTKVTIEYEDLDDRMGRCKGHDIHASSIGKSVFLTKAEAEEALEKMKGEE